MRKLPPRHVVVFKITKKVPQLIVDAGAIAEGMLKHSSIFTSPDPDITDFKLHIEELNDAAAAFINRTASKTTRDIKQSAVVADIRKLKLYVQRLVDASPEQAAVIANYACMKLKVFHKKQKEVFRAKNNMLPGVIDLFAAGGPRGSFHEWCMSTDKITWTELTSTVKGKTQVTGLESISAYYFRHRITTPKEGKGDWEQPFYIVVQ
jgi:hypothetical protein